MLSGLAGEQRLISNNPDRLRQAVQITTLRTELL
jgi:hypothetical protein